MKLIRGERRDNLLRMAKARWRGRKSPFGVFRGWDVWGVDGVALLFKRGRCLRMYWDEYRQLKRQRGN